MPGWYSTVRTWTASCTDAGARFRFASPTFQMARWPTTLAGDDELAFQTASFSSSSVSI